MGKAVNPRKILFVCTGNVFRSMTAKYCLMDYLKRKGISDTVINSAGTVAKKEGINPTLYGSLISLGIDPSGHRQKRLTKKDLLENDIVIVMAQSHADFIQRKFGFDNVTLFNSIVNGEDTSVLDVDDVVKDPNGREAKKYIRDTARYIHRSVPALYTHLDDYLLFLDFINGRKTQMKGFPFMPLHETKNTIAFMSISIPQKEDGHILVIPKKRYTHLDAVPKPILAELIGTVTTVGKALRRTHGGYNVLLNNGRAAGQYVFHTHFHIIPRNRKDDIRIEVWKSKKLTFDEFVSLNERIRNALA